MIAEVIVDISNSEIDKVFDYIVPEGEDIRPGQRVEVPFGRQRLEGVVIALKPSPTTSHALKQIEKKLDPEPLILPEFIELMRFMRKKNLRYADCLRLFIPGKLRGGRVRELKRNHLFINTAIDLETGLKSIPARASAQRKLYTELYDMKSASEREILEKYSSAPVRALINAGLILKESVAEARIPGGMTINGFRPELTALQSGVVERLLSGSGTFLLHGVTGSGKTEVYLRVIEDALKRGKNAIMLVPEIALTPQMLGIFRARFGDMVSIQHSGLSDGERFDEWMRLRRGTARVALGARSAIFAPLTDVGVIIMDEEHDSSYISDSNPRYFTSEIASFRAEYNSAKLILGSATPSVESYFRAQKGEYTLLEMPERVNEKPMPLLETVDMREEIRRGNLGLFSSKLVREIESALNEKNQVMLFLNRRGYASFLRCRNCGYVPKCPDCDVSLTYHIEDNTLRCHYCGARFKSIDSCPLCGYEDLKEGKTGTEKLEQETKRLFPSARVLRMDNDTTRRRDAYTEILSEFSSGGADILVGTQMIAKGHDFGAVTLVGIIDADIALYYSDYRSAERTFQLITQVAGRAGRADKAGRVVMQTYSPNHYVYKFAKSYDYRGFYENEIRARELTKYPPFTKIVRLLVLSEAENEARNAARGLAAEAATLKKNMPGIFRVQVMQSAIKRLRSYYRYQAVIWIDTSAEDEICPELYEMARRKTSGKVTVFTEINPQQML